jgi:hypothetical protein
MDHRDRARTRYKLHVSADGHRAAVDLGDEEPTLMPVKYEVCPTCEGRGHHVSPSIDEHGLSPQDFEEDPDFAEDYMSGRYDVTCYGCDGQRVVAEVDRERCDPEDLARYDAYMEEVRRSEQERDAERRCGA